MISPISIVLIDELNMLFMSYLQSSSYSLKNRRCELLNNKLEKLEEKFLLDIKKNEDEENIASFSFYPKFFM